MNDAEYFIPVNEWEPFTARAGSPDYGAWSFCKRLDLTNSLPVARHPEPIEADVEFYADQVSDLVREVRVVAVVSSSDASLREIPSQVCSATTAENVASCRLFFHAELGPGETKTYLILYGNPAAPAPRYETDLEVSGEEYALDVENEFYRIELAKTMGHLKNITFKQGDTVLNKGVSVEGAYRGHGVESSIHHNPDWSDEHTGRYRMTSWTEPPNYEVIRGPVCVRTRRWGHPILALGPGIGQCHKVMASVTYSFYASVPYVIMESRLDVLEDVRFGDSRNDEWVGMGRDMPNAAWRLGDGEIGFGTHGWSKEDPAWLTFFSEETGDAFATIHMEYECSHPDWHEPRSVTISDQWGGLWVRYPLGNTLMRKGDFIREKNAYLLHRYEPERGSGFEMLTETVQALANSPAQEEVSSPPAPLTEASVWNALRFCSDHEIYIKGGPYTTRRLSYVDLGWIRGVAIAGDAVNIKLVLPYPGREVSFDAFAETIETQVRERVEGVGKVQVELVREPPWSQDEMTHRGRRAMGLGD